MVNFSKCEHVCKEEDRRVGNNAGYQCTEGSSGEDWTKKPALGMMNSHIISPMLRCLILNSLCFFLMILPLILKGTLGYLEEMSW